MLLKSPGTDARTGEPLKSVGRVVLVEPRDDGLFSVEIGPAPDMVWWTTKTPPRLGEKVEIEGVVIDRREIKSDGLTGTITILRPEHQEVVPEPYHVREVPPGWRPLIEKTMRRSLYSYQVDGAAWLASRLSAHKGAILGDDPGLGKTTQVIAAIAALRLYPAIIVCPAPLKIQWAREFEWCFDPPTVTVIEGRMSAFELCDVMILNYDLLKTRMVQLVQTRARLVVFDEIQAIKNPRPSHRQHRALAGTFLAHKVGLAVGMTGTPIMNKPPDLWRLLHTISKHDWPHFDDFLQDYCRAPKGGQLREGKRVVTSVGRVEQLERLTAKVGPFLMRRLKSQVLPDLPSKSRRSVAVKLPPVEWAHYQAAKKNVVAYLRHVGAKKRASRAALAKGVAQMGILRRIVALGKLRQAIPFYLRQWFTRNAHEPLVIFGYHKDVMMGLFNICRALGLRVCGIGGGEALHKRQAAIDAFQKGLADVFLAPILCAGVGLTLHRASEALFVERMFSYSQMIQAEDRIHRIGQSRPVVITYLDAAGTIDEHVQVVLDEKRKLIEAVVDGLIDGETETQKVVEAVAERMMD